MGWGHMATSSNAGMANTHPAQGMTSSQLSMYAQQQFGNAYNGYAQQAAAQQYARAQQQAFYENWQERRWAIDGKYMSLQDFANYIWPEDCAEKTFFILKHTKENSND